MIKLNRRQWCIALTVSAFTMFSPLSYAEELPKVLMRTSMGEITLELYPEKAPKTVANFLRYVKSGHYNKTIFHRVIDNFMIQGGGYDAKAHEKPVNKPIPLEAKYAFEHGLKNQLGTIAMARTQDPNSAAAQFFINVNDNDFLDYQELSEGDPVAYTKRGEIITASRAQALQATAGYAPFGKVIKGMEVVERIKAVATGNSGMLQNFPEKTVLIESVKLIK